MGRSWAVALLRLSEQQRAIVSHLARPALPPPRQASDAGTESAPVLVQQLAVMLSVLPLALGAFSRTHTFETDFAPAFRMGPPRRTTTSPR